MHKQRGEYLIRNDRESFTIHEDCFVSESISYYNNNFEN